MDYSDINAASWAFYLPVFKNTLRPSSGDPAMDGMADEMAEAITKARAEISGLGELGDRLVNLVFDGYDDWYKYEDSWILNSLSQVLDDQGSQENELLSALDEIVNSVGTDTEDSAFADFLSSAERCADVWQTEAAQQQYVSGPVRPGEERAIATYENTESWNYSRTPGTFYYRYVDGKYLYNDRDDAPAGEWHEMRYWDDLAWQAASTPEGDLSAVPGWGSAWAGWVTIPTTDASRFGDRVYSKGTDGPWLTRDQAIAGEQAEEAQVSTSTEPSQAAEATAQQNAIEEAHKLLDEIVRPAEERLRNDPQFMAAVEQNHMTDEQLTDLIRKLTAQQIVAAPNS